jgi:hypothetical protein
VHPVQISETSSVREANVLRAMSRPLDKEA